MTDLNMFRLIFCPPQEFSSLVVSLNKVIQNFAESKNSFLAVVPILQVTEWSRSLLLVGSQRLFIFWNYCR